MIRAVWGILTKQLLPLSSYKLQRTYCNTVSSSSKQILSLILLNRMPKP